MSSTDSGPLANVTAAQVLAWGKAQPTETVIGVCRNAHACLIASYALHVLGIVIAVGPGVTMPGTYYFPDAAQNFCLPPDLNRLALDFDRLSGARNGTARRMHPADLDRLAVQS